MSLDCSQVNCVYFLNHNWAAVTRVEFTDSGVGEAELWEAELQAGGAGEGVLLAAEEERLVEDTCRLDAEEEHVPLARGGGAGSGAPPHPTRPRCPNPRAIE